MGTFYGYGVNKARLNGADVEPIPVRPVQHQNWPEMQVQLHNGYCKITTHKVATDHYLRMLSHMQPGQAYKPLSSGMPKIGPAPANVQKFYDDSAGSQPTNPGGPGFVLPGIAGSFEGSY